METIQVTAASLIDSHSAEPNPGVVKTSLKPDRPANRSAAYSGTHEVDARR